MPVELRARRTRPSYKTLLDLPDDEGGPPLPEHEDDASSESAFELTYPQDGQGRAGDEDDVHETHDDKPSIQDESDIVPGSSKSKVRGKGKGKGKGKAAATNRPTMASLHRPALTMLAPGLSRPNARQYYALPLPNLNHRHRGTPVYLPPLRTYRLVSKPGMFSYSQTVQTRSIADPVVRERVGKAIGHNIGRGPVWELMEDLSWFKECPPGGQTRPIVYDTLRVERGWELLSVEQASPYIPKNVDGLSQSPPMTCFFGTYDNQTKVQLDLLQSHNMGQFFPESNSHVFYTGAPVWAIDWCPVFVNDQPYRSYKQHLAVAPFPSHSHSPEIGRRVTRPSPASIQIWSLSPTQRALDSESMGVDQHEDPGVMKCELILCIDGGPAHDLKWCPLPSHDKYSSNTLSEPRKLGILGGTFEDGSASFYVVPDPGYLISSEHGSSTPHHVRLSPSLRIELEVTMCWSMDWANSELLAVGCTNGSVAIFRVKEALEHPPQQPLRPTHYFALHQSAIRSVSWVRAPPTSVSGVSRLDRDPTVIVSGGYDGAQMVTDIRDLRGNIMNRTRDVINSIVFSNHVGGPIASDHENLIKNFGITPSTLGRGHGLLEPSGPAWSIATSDFHPQVAVGSADGSCQTTNMMKSTRRSGAVPFFIHKIFQIDFSRTTGEYRMLENFLPYEHQDRPTASRATKKDIELPVSTGAWSPEVSVTRVVWQSGSGLAQAPLLVSATASGLCRVDWLLGQFNKNRFPYQNIEKLRGEVEGAIDEDAEDE